MLPGNVEQLPQRQRDDIGTGIEIDAKAQEDQRQIGAAIAREGHANAVEHFSGADLHIGGKYARTPAGFDQFADDFDNWVGQPFALESVKHVTGLVEASGIGQHAGIDFGHTRHVGLCLKGACGQLQSKFSIACGLGHQRAMEHQELVEPVGAELLHQCLRIIAAIVTDHGPGTQNAGSDAAEAVLRNLAELPHRKS